MTSRNGEAIRELLAVMARLRDPDGGCPWDLEQDFASIAPYTIEEAYEVADAINRGDMADLKDELGDLLLQVVYHTQMAGEKNLFGFDEVAAHVAAKMIHRHPHVFGDEKADTAADVMDSIWDRQKAKEKGGRESALDGVTLGLPALLRAEKLQKRAAKVGFEWARAADVLDKLEEEIGEMREAALSGNIEHMKDELGDLFFVLVNFARMLGINAEEAARHANDKFERRFRGMEADLRAEGMRLEDCALDRMEEGWQAQKRKEKRSGSA